MPYAAIVAGLRACDKVLAWDRRDFQHILRLEIHDMLLSSKVRANDVTAAEMIPSFPAFPGFFADKKNNEISLLEGKRLSTKVNFLVKLHVKFLEEELPDVVAVRLGRELIMCAHELTELNTKTIKKCTAQLKGQKGAYHAHRMQNGFDAALETALDSYDKRLKIVDALSAQRVARTVLNAAIFYADLGKYVGKHWYGEWIMDGENMTLSRIVDMLFTFKVDGLKQHCRRIESATTSLFPDNSFCPVTIEVVAEDRMQPEKALLFVKQLFSTGYIALWRSSNPHDSPDVSYIQMVETADELRNYAGSYVCRALTLLQNGRLVSHNSCDLCLFSVYKPVVQYPWLLW
jgi:hypothetical protein